MVQDIITYAEILAQTPPGCRPCRALPKPSTGTALPWPGTFLCRYLRAFDLIPLQLQITNTQKFIKHSPVQNTQDYFVTTHSRPGCLPVTLTGHYISSPIPRVLWDKRALSKQDLFAEFMSLLKCTFYAPTQQLILFHDWKHPASSITLSRGKSMYSLFLNMAAHICMHPCTCVNSTHPTQNQSCIRGCEKKSLRFKGSAISPGYGVLWQRRYLQQKCLWCL